MTHSRSLRVIGQSLHAARLADFEIETAGRDFLIKSNSLTAASEWILRHALRPFANFESNPLESRVREFVRFTPADILRLDDQAKKQRRTDRPRLGQTSSGLSQLLRALGDHLERIDVHAFHISWTPGSIRLDFESRDGQTDSRTFTSEKLLQLGAHLRFRRAAHSFRFGIPIHKKHSDD
jgi:hypothetical protein